MSGSITTATIKTRTKDNKEKTEIVVLIVSFRIFIAYGTIARA